MRKSVPKLHQRFIKKPSYSPLPVPSLASLLSILSTPHKDRTPVQILQLEDYMQSITFFSDLIKNVNRQVMLQCCQFMTLEQYSEGEFVFHADDEADKFYVILSGSVTILRPNGRVDGKRTYQQLAVLKAGSSFGELALIQSTSRSASVLCRELTHLGVLMRQHYLRILGKVQGLLLAKKVDLLQSNPVFAPWSRTSLLKLSYFFKERVYQRKQVLFHAGDLATEVCLVQGGDFELVKDISVHVRKNLHQLKDCDRLRCQAEVTLVSVGEMMGGLEVLKGSPHRYTCVCYSMQGEVLCISKDDFLKRMTSEEAVNTVFSLNSAIESQREMHVQRVSQREQATHDSSSVLFSFGNSSVSSSVLQAKMKLEAEVCDRWFLPRLRNKGKLGHSVSVSPLCSPSPSPHKRISSDLLSVHGLDCFPDTGFKLGKPGLVLKPILPSFSPRKRLNRKKAESTTRLASELVISPSPQRTPAFPPSPQDFTAIYNAASLHGTDL